MQEHSLFIDQIMKGLIAIRQLIDIEYEYNSRELIYQRDKVKLYRYQAKIKNSNKTPLLIVFATVNRPEILDLFPERSFIRVLLDNGIDVYLLDWGYPDADDNIITFSDYVADYLHACVKKVSEKSHSKKINLLGICQGGVICLSYATLFPLIKNLVVISTPIDFHSKDNIVAKFLKKVDFKKMIQMGNVPGAWLTEFFISLRPFELIGKKYLKFVDEMKDEKRKNRFLLVEKWLYDAPDQARDAFKEFVSEFYKKNNLIKGKITINGQKVNLARITVPIFNVMAEEDEIVPISASLPLKKYLGSQDYTQEIFPSGHIGIYISDKVGRNMAQAIATWLNKR